MKEFNGEIQYKEKKYKLVFNLNVMEEIQEKYGTVEKWGELTEGVQSEPNIKAIIFGFAAMINEGIDIENEETGNKTKAITLKQAGRIISEIGLAEATQKLNKTVVESTDSGEKNA